MTEKLIATSIIMLCGAILTFSRRWNNKDTDAGIGVAGWTMLIIVLLWID